MEDSLPAQTKFSLPDVLILHNRPRPSAHLGGFLESDAGVLEEVAAVEAALAESGVRFRTAAVAYLTDLPAVLAAAREPVVFNLVESFHDGPDDAALVPAVCRAFGKEATGGSTDCLIPALDKAQAKAILAARGLPVPRGVVVIAGGKLATAGLPPPPWIVKPARSDASEGIHAESCIFQKPGPRLNRALARLHEQFQQPVIVEELVDGREINVSVLQDGAEAGVVAIAEIIFQDFEPERPRIVDYAAKWLPDSFEYQNTPRVVPAPVGKRLERRLRELSLRAWRSLNCTDYARVDFRVAADGSPCILEVNPNPDISPGGGFAAAVEAAGMKFAEFVCIVVANASARQQAMCAGKPLEPAASPPAEPRRLRSAGSPEAAAGSPPPIRRTVAADRDAVLELVAATGAFRPDEMDVAREVLDEAIAQGAGGHYQSYAAEVEGRVAGWVCFGPTPCTIGTWDVYWLAVSPLLHGRGIGTRLMNHAHAMIAGRGGRLAIVETSGRPDYERARGFYLACGYREASRLPDFYAPGDDKIVYSRMISAR